VGNELVSEAGTEEMDLRVIIIEFCGLGLGEVYLAGRGKRYLE
jgi:hypothetical protein